MNRSKVQHEPISGSTMIELQIGSLEPIEGSTMIELQIGSLEPIEGST